MTSKSGSTRERNFIIKLPIEHTHKNAIYAKVSGCDKGNVRKSVEHVSNEGFKRRLKTNTPTEIYIDRIKS